LYITDTTYYPISFGLSSDHL